MTSSEYSCYTETSSYIHDIPSDGVYGCHGTLDITPQIWLTPFLNFVLVVTDDFTGTLTLSQTHMLFTLG